jgi:hypothetical protein
MSDAARFAEVLLGVLGAVPKPVTEEERTRIASRCAPLSLEHLTPYFPSIERDPIHPAAAYVCADGVDSQPLLLRAAPASSPSSGLFPKSILIGRTHLSKFEVVINAIPFGPGDDERIAVFSQKVNKVFRPRSSGSKPVIVIRSDAPAQTLPAVFDAFRRRLKATGRSQLAFAGIPESVISWAAIRAGWREGYSLDTFESAAATIDVTPDMSSEDIEFLIP